VSQSASPCVVLAEQNMDGNPISPVPSGVDYIIISSIPEGLNSITIIILYIRSILTKMSDFYYQFFFYMDEGDSSASPRNESRNSGMNEESPSILRFILRKI
jgi:hypothetical protein